MTIARSKETGCMMAQCDQCFDIVDFDDLDDPSVNQYTDAKDYIDVDGWKTIRVNGKWINICPDCK